MAIQADYAIKTKRRGDAGDYRVTAWSRGRLEVKEYEDLYRRLSVGTMPFSKQATAESPPWMTYGTYRRDGSSDLYIVAIRQEWTDQADGHGSRPIAVLCCVCLPYEQLSATRASYLTLFEYIPSYTIMALHADHPLSLDVPDERPEETVALIERVGFESVAATAALVLQSPVAIVKGGALSARERLAYLEAVAHLLPYGCRASLSVSSWMQSTSATGVHLGFTDGAHAAQKRVVWDVSPAVDLVAGSSAQRYFTALCALKECRGTADLVAGLAQWRMPLSLDDGLRVLQAIPRHGATRHAARDGHDTGVDGNETQHHRADSAVPLAPPRTGDVAPAPLQATVMRQHAHAPAPGPVPGMPGGIHGFASASPLARRCAALLSRRDERDDDAAVRLAIGNAQVGSVKDLASFIAQLRQALLGACATVEAAHDAEVRFVHALAKGSAGAIVEAYVHALITSATLDLEEIAVNVPLLWSRLSPDVRTQWMQCLRAIQDSMASDFMRDDARMSRRNARPTGHGESDHV